MDRRQVRMSELLEAAGVSLDEECSRCAEFNLTGERARLRRIGLELDVTLFYSNLWFSWRLDSTYIVRMMSSSLDMKDLSNANLG